MCRSRCTSASRSSIFTWYVCLGMSVWVPYLQGGICACYLIDRVDCLGEFAAPPLFWSKIVQSWIVLCSAMNTGANPLEMRAPLNSSGGSRSLLSSSNARQVDTFPGFESHSCRRSSSNVYGANLQACVFTRFLVPLAGGIMYGVFFGQPFITPATRKARRSRSACSLPKTKDVTRGR